MSLTNYPNLDRAIWSLLTVVVAYAIGLLVNWIVIHWLQRLASKTEGQWDDVVVRELRKRIPLWSLLVGLRLALFHWPLAEKWVGLASNAILAAAVLSVTMALAAMAVGLLGDLAPRINPEVQVSGLMRNVVRGFIISVGLLVVLRGVGVEITPVLAALGVGGLAIALALQDPLANLFSGLFITLAGRVRMGDYVRLDTGAEGYVTDFSWHATKLRALPGNLIVVPNAKLAQAIITNYDRPTREMGFGVEITVEPDADLAEVERIGLGIAQAVMREVPGGVPGADVAVRFQAFSDLGVRCAIVVRASKFEDQFLIRHEIGKRLHEALKRAGIGMATLGKAEGRRKTTEVQSSGG
jgi:small-conductance mechanosensitive channel